ncbi:MAG: alpha/beta hydrolase [Deltaproteobacteria bacterium]|nr:alpha/beta hydrolase [Deltaproteobacteria bacterium]
MTGLHVVERGTEGPTILLIHGSAADADAFTIPLALLSGGARGGRPHRVVAYDRRGTSRSPQGDSPPSLASHAADSAGLIERLQLAPCLAIGSSFGAVVALELARRRPELLRGVVLAEPPLAASDSEPRVPDGFWETFDARQHESGSEAAAEHFLRTVLGDAFDRLSETHKARALSHGIAIRNDARALEAYSPRYDTLSSLGVPVMLLGGDRSPEYFRRTLDALERALGRWCVLRMSLSAGHMMYAEAARAFREAILVFESALGAREIE